MNDNNTWAALAHLRERRARVVGSWLATISTTAAAGTLLELNLVRGPRRAGTVLLAAAPVLSILAVAQAGVLDTQIHETQRAALLAAETERHN
ncbi:hypothetical protein [Saccharopolyspora griseoalba]|uniref:Uncharacterized protein n=1 Tax=Saccharopolyspora griseoalba TaxID=1431848 RepID=A0ABW2LPW2_9PSEU